MISRGVGGCGCLVGTFLLLLAAQQEDEHGDEDGQDKDAADDATNNDTAGVAFAVIVGQRGLRHRLCAARRRSVVVDLIGTTEEGRD
jgi:hypothetical protein